MREVYITALILAAILQISMMGYSLCVRKLETKKYRNVLIWVLVAVLVNIGLAEAHGDKTILLFESIYFVSIDWLINGLNYFLNSYDVRKPTKIKKIMGGCIHFCIVVDTFSLLLNNVFGHCFYHTAFYSETGELYWKVEAYWPYSLHLLFAYSMLVYTVYILARNIRFGSRFYRLRFVRVGQLILVAVGIDALFVYASQEFNWAPVLLSAFSFIIMIEFYYSIPNKLIDMTTSVMIQDFNDGIIIYDNAGNPIFVNASLYDICSVDKDERKLGSVAKYVSDWFIDDNSIGITDIEERKYVRSIPGEAGIRKYIVDIRRNYDELGQIMGTYIQIHDCTDEDARMKHDLEIARIDSLTGCYNASFFYEEARRTLEENPDVDYYMLTSNICQFKLINDIYGQDEGDKLLIRIADALKKYSKEGDLYARLANDHFAFLIPKKNFNEEVFINGPKNLVVLEIDRFYPLRICVGVYEISDRDVPVSVMCDRANMAIKTIEGEFEKRIAFYNDEIRDESLREQEVLRRLDDAIVSGELTICLQPQVDRRGTTIGAEVLSRWTDENGNRIPPFKYIGMLEKTGSIYKHDLHMWEAACKLLKRWETEGATDRYLSVNVSPRDFYFIDVVETLKGLVEKYDIEAKNLKIELTEETMISDAVMRNNVIDRLHEAGFIVEMDDFGSGYSSLNMLKDLDMDVIKIDMGFLRNSNTPDKTRIIVGAMVRMIKDLGREVVAEGVETIEQVEMMKEFGTDVIQGYYYSKPITVDEFERRMVQEEIRI